MPRDLIACSLGNPRDSGFADYLIIAGPIKREAPSFLPLPVEIRNSGGEKAEGIELVTRRHKWLNRIENDFLARQSPEVADRITYHCIDSQDHQTALLSIGAVGPGEALVVQDGFTFNDAYPLSLEKEAGVMDYHQLKVPYHRFLAHDLTFSLFVKGEEPVQRNLKVIIVDTAESPLAQQLDKYNRAVEQQHKQNSVLKRLFGGKAEPESLSLLEFDERCYQEGDADMATISLNNAVIRHGYFDPSGAVVIRPGQP
ncbi:hypothetical protein [Motiliproteus sp. SC1-56]|uniref:hypothetical protein n=1 Tax=Motiliproteus sp. SC1-56 TaxID=2799565 RepID=UPI001A8CD726|nr:hypothetical protein [Motiliproteus sp. SC1-56]